MQNTLTFPLFSIKKNGSSQRFLRWNDPNPNHDITMARAIRPIPQLSESDKERFFAKISAAPTATGCLEWKAGKSKCGYGIFNLGGEPTLSHRISYFCHYGEDPIGLCILHACDNRACCNPEHLSMGTHLDNSRDMVSKGRHALGEDRPLAKLTESDILAIRKDTRPQRVIGAEYGVSHALIGGIKLRERWKHVVSEAINPQPFL